MVDHRPPRVRNVGGGHGEGACHGRGGGVDHGEASAAFWREREIEGRKKKRRRNGLTFFFYPCHLHVGPICIFNSFDD